MCKLRNHFISLVIMNTNFLLFILVTVFLQHSLGESYNPLPNENSVVKAGHARFTVLTSRLIRMEWGQTVDSATLTFINRYLPAVDYSLSDHSDIVIETDHLKLQYTPDGESFHSENLKVEIKDLNEVWTPTPYTYDSIRGNLLGTVRTLDGNDGSKELLNCQKSDVTSTHCTLGLISRDGYAIVDDTGHPQFDNSTDWPWVTTPNKDNNTNQVSCPRIDYTARSCGFPMISEEDCKGRGCCWSDSLFHSIKCYYSTSSPQDLYIFGHGHDYKGALYDFTLVAGKIPLPPRYTFGVFYSRYWAYSDIGDMEVVREYKSRKIPLDNLVTDMDWHITFYKEAEEGVKDASGQSKGWSGFTWDKNLFPNPEAFLAWCKVHNLRNTLNLHPASGIQMWEDTFTQMIEAMGLNSSAKYVPWRPTDKKFVNNFFKIVLQPLQESGIDYWWLDWQQGESGSSTGIDIPNVNPTFWINYLFFNNPYQWGPIANRTKRPLLLHRWGGLGNHRYQIGFSGDVVPGWASLHYQVYFTLRASNVLFGYWSHDLGGHTQPSPPELYTRWVQWGAFSPIFRTHCTKNAKNDRRIWTYPLENYQIMREAMILRGSLVPYIYTYSREAYDTGLSLLRAMYFEYPEHDEAYMYDRQYFFGRDILVAPITEPVNETTQVVNKTIWIPPGSYVSWTHGKLISSSNGDIKMWSYTLSEIPLFVRSGSIIPMLTEGYNIDPLGSAFRPVTSLKLMIFIGDAPSGNGFLYEDDGESEGYKTGNFTVVTFSYNHDKSQSMIDVVIEGASAGYSGFPSMRNYQIVIPNFWPAENVSIDGKSVQYCTLMDSFQEYTNDCWTYDGSNLALVVNIVSQKPTKSAIKMQVKYGKYDVFDPYNVNVNLDGTTKSIGFTGMIKRLVSLKNLIDDQWGIDTIYQESYESLIDASEIGMRITFTPTNISSLIMDFRDKVEKNYDNLYDLRVSANISAQLEAQIMPEN